MIDFEFVAQGAIGRRIVIHRVEQIGIRGDFAVFQSQAFDFGIRHDAHQIEHDGPQVFGAAVDVVNRVDHLLGFADGPGRFPRQIYQVVIDGGDADPRENFRRRENLLDAEVFVEQIQVLLAQPVRREGKGLAPRGGVEPGAFRCE